MVLNDNGDILSVRRPLRVLLTILMYLQSSQAVHATAFFYVKIDYPKYMAHLQQVSQQVSQRLSPRQQQLPNSVPLQSARQTSPAPADVQPQSAGSKRVISFSVYGTKLRYVIGALKNAILAQRHGPPTRHTAPHRSFTPCCLSPH
jgi:hypothetical protein